MVVLTYHKIKEKCEFEKQILYLSRHYQIVDEFTASKTAQRQLIITADDGDPSFYHNAFPVLKKYKLPAILFVVTDLINTQKPFWWDEIEYYLGKEEGNKKVWEVKGWPNKKREAYLEELRIYSNKEGLEFKQLTTAQLKEMQEAGIKIANHSHTHPMFDKCTREELEIELARSTAILKDFGFTPNVFAYPNGNYSVESEVILKEYGIKQAYLFDHKLNKGELDPLRISRFIVNDTTPMWKYRIILRGWHTRILPLTRFVARLTGRLKK